MRVYRSIWMLGFAALAPGCAPSPQIRPPRALHVGNVGEVNELIGTWRLVEFWDRDSAAAPKRYAYGERPTGYFTYDPTGHVSIQIQQGPKSQRIGSERGEDWFQIATLEELRATVRAYRAYFGTYTVDRATGIVIHRVEGDSRGFYTGSDQRRQYRIKGDSLIIGNDSTARRVLVRVR